MKAYWKVLGLGLMGSLLATACVISSDDDGGFNFNFDAGTPDASTVADSGKSDATLDAGSTSHTDAGGQMCVGPSGNSCSDCVTNHCLAEYCACDADGDCGGEGGEFACMNECMIGKSGENMGVTKAEAFQECGNQCDFDGDGILADATNALIDCMQVGVPDPLFADSGIDGGQVAVCGEHCFGYTEPGAQ